jgi:NTE family protein
MSAEFWTAMEHKPWWEDSPFFAPWVSKSMAAEWTNKTAHMTALFAGVPGYYAPNSALALGGVNAPLGVEGASLYTTEQLEKTLAALIDPAWLNSGKPRLTVSSVNVKSGSMQYWDSASAPLSLTHVLASAALPISFPAVRIDGDPYWDGGIYSNTPIEVVFDDNPRRDSIVFADQMWHSSGPEPQTFLDVLIISRYFITARNALSDAKAAEGGARALVPFGRRRQIAPACWSGRRPQVPQIRGT